MDELAYRKRPWHTARCAVPGCSRFGFRSDACRSCNEYHCEKHADVEVQGDEMDRGDDYSVLLSKDGGERCFPCFNSAARHLSDGTDDPEEGEEEKTADDVLSSLREQLQGGAHRERFLLLMLDKWSRDLARIDESDASPLERKMWAGMLVRSLDRYFEPQVELYDTSGRYIVRADFASTLLRIALFTDGETYHSKPADVARDQGHNRRLEAMGWKVLRYRTRQVEAGFRQVLTEVYEVTAARCHQLHVDAGWLPGLLATKPHCRRVGVRRLIRVDPG